MKKIIFFLLTFQVSCATMYGTKNKAVQRYICARDFVELKVNPSEAMKFCKDNFREEIEK